VILSDAAQPSFAVGDIVNYSRDGTSYTNCTIEEIVSSIGQNVGPIYRGDKNIKYRIAGSDIPGGSMVVLEKYLGKA
jgi:hypothetical protein